MAYPNVKEEENLRKVSEKKIDKSGIYTEFLAELLETEPLVNTKKPGNCSVM